MENFYSRRCLAVGPGLPAQRGINTTFGRPPTGLYFRMTLCTEFIFECWST